MFKVGRICIPLGLECNLKCKYCFREKTLCDTPRELNELMKWYLQNISPEWCKAVIMSGGEPLIFWRKIKEIFSLLPKDVGRCFMTNGTLLTQEIVDYANEHKIEVALSHDGEHTEYLRGVDVLKEPHLLNLIRQIKRLTILSVVTSVNPDVIDIYRYISGKLERDNFYFLPSAIMDNGKNQALIDGFDYDVYAKSYREFVDNYHKTTGSRELKESEHCSFNVDLHGNVVNKITLHKFGTVLDDYAVCSKRKEEFYKDGYCNTSDCPLKGECTFLEEYADAHSCKCSMIRSGFI